MKHQMRHDGYCSCGGIPLYVGDPQDMLTCSISGEVLRGERAQRSLRELNGGSASYLTPEQRQNDIEEFKRRVLRGEHGSN